MPDLEQGRSLLAMARKDLRAMEILAAAGGSDDEIIGYHAQQAVEKAIKAWLCFLDVEYPLTHDVRALMARLAERGIELPEYSDALMDLTDFAVQYRYETLMAGEAIDRDATLDSVRQFLRLVMEAEPVTMPGPGSACSSS